MKSDVELKARATNHELTITYRAKTWVLLAYPLEDFGVWEVVAHEQGLDTPAMPAIEWGVASIFVIPGRLYRF